MAAKAAAGAGARANDTGGNTSSQDDNNVLTRRKIYYYRLIGDLGDHGKKKTQRSQSLKVVIRFSTYAAIANFVIYNRAMIFQVFDVTNAITKALQGASWNPGATSPSTFEDVRTVDDVKQWIQFAFIPQTRYGMPHSNPLSIASYNRITPQDGVCANSAALVLTLRRVRTTSDYAKTTTDRFVQLQRDAWSVSKIEAGSDFNEEHEDTTTIRDTFVHRGDPVQQMIPVPWYGQDEWGKELNPTLYPNKGKNVYVEWKYTSADTIKSQIKSYRNKGGFVALLTLGSIDPQNGTISSPDQFVHLLSPDGDSPGNNPNVQVCGTSRSTNILTLSDFFESKEFFSKLSTSITLEGAVYNGNYQTMSYLHVQFNADSTGLVTTKNLAVNTFRLDIFDTSTFILSLCTWAELAYLISSLVYFCLLAYHVWSKWHQATREFWTYMSLASIISSLLSIGIWLMILKPLMREFLISSDFMLRDNVQAADFTFIWYVRASAFAVFTIWWRLLEALKGSKARVRLLMETLGMAFTNMAIYISYIMVILMGFWAVAITTFSASSTRFNRPETAFVSCFQLFLGKVEVMEGLPPTIMKRLFYLAFMVFFFFICVQMFNAIINYSYNRVSEEMEPIFEHERREKRSKEMTKKLASKNKKNPLQQCRDMLTKFLFNKEEEKENPKQDVAPGQTMPSQQRDAPIFEQIADENMRSKVETFMGKEKQRKAPDGVFNICMFAVFAGSYIFFLFGNLDVGTNAKIQTAVKSAIDDSVAVSPFDSSQTMRLDEVRTVDNIMVWLASALPVVMFESTPAELMSGAEEGEVFARESICIHTWNCVVKGYSKFNNENPLLLRITQRRMASIDNEGIASIKTGLEAEDRFIGGFYEIDDNGAVTVSSSTQIKPRQEMSRLLTPSRRTTSGIQIDSPMEEDGEDLNWLPPNFNLTGVSLCTREDEATGNDPSQWTPARISCLLDSRKEEFEAQLNFLVSSESDFISLKTGSIMVEFVAFNGNTNSIVLAQIQFVVMPSGLVNAKSQVTSVALMNLPAFRERMGTIINRLLPGLVYVFLVIYFFVILITDLTKEWARKEINLQQGRMKTTIEFFTLDIFNTLEVISIGISMVSFVLYVVWLANENSVLVPALEKGTLPEILDAAASLVYMVRWYNRLSATNMLIIFVRPLKFVRENPRMAKLNQTLFDAQTDVVWFVLVFVVATIAFVMLAYISFGGKLEEVSTIPNCLNYCFYYILGQFAFDPIAKADPMMAVIFFFPFLIIFYCVFTNIFFAIIDRNFVSAEPPPFNLKRNLKPIFSKCCTCIEWDEDYAMEDDPSEKKKQGPESRKNRVQRTAEKIDQIKQSEGENVYQAGGKQTSKQLNDVCDMDEKLNDVLNWSREEAAQFTAWFQALYMKKQLPQKLKNEEGFVKQDVMKDVDFKLGEEREAMEQAERQKRYAIQVHEKMVIRDQETLARYIFLLEAKLRKKMGEKKSLLMEVHHLRGECDKMRFYPEELKLRSGTDTAVTSNPQNGDGDLALTDGTRAEADEEESGEEDEAEYARANGVASGREPNKDNATKEMASASMLSQLAAHNA